MCIRDRVEVVQIETVASQFSGDLGNRVYGRQFLFHNRFRPSLVGRGQVVGLLANDLVVSTENVASLLASDCVKLAADCRGSGL